MADLEEYELERTASPNEPPPPLPPEPEKKEGGLLFPAMLALAAIVVVGLLAALYVLFRTPPEPEAGATPPPVAATPQPLPTAVPGASPLVLPSLDESDGLVRELLTAASSHPELARWLAQSHLIRTATAVTVNVATGESPRPHLRFLEPKTRFAARQVGGALVPDPAGFSGYDVMADAIASLDAGAAAETYRSLEPLFEIAFQDFGMPDVRFRTILHRAVDNLLAVPVPGPDVELVPHATTFRYRDSRYEQLSPAQKQFLRMGPGNVRAVQTWLRGFKAALGSPAERPPSGPAR